MVKVVEVMVDQHGWGRNKPWLNYGQAIPSVASDLVLI